jgi:hypothetical protein
MAWSSAGTLETMSAESWLAAVNCCCNCCKVVHPSPAASIWDLIAIRSLMVLFVSVESASVGPTRLVASVSFRFADASTTGIPALIAESRPAALAKIVEGTGGVAVIAAFRAFT